MVMKQFYVDIPINKTFSIDSLRITFSPEFSAEKSDLLNHTE